MESTIEYLVKMEEDLARQDFEGYDCTGLAKEIAQRLVREGQSPSIIRIRSIRNSGAYFVDDTLVPRKYPDRMWKHHDVCEANSLIYDPLIGHPLPIRQYFEEAFGEGFEVMSSELPSELFKSIVGNEFDASERYIHQKQSSCKKVVVPSRPPNNISADN
jgi:hypothetical protein